jgi:hypothetical protein
LPTAIQEFLDARNRDPKPYVCVKTADDIFQTVVRFAQRTLATQSQQD